MYAQTVSHRGHSSQATGPASCFPAPSRKRDRHNFFEDVALLTMGAEPANSGSTPEITA